MSVASEVDVVRGEADGLVEEIKSQIRRNYLATDSRPWIIAFSGGKDSTLVAQLVFEALQSIPPLRRQRPIYVLSSDTQVETPYVVDMIRWTLDRLREASQSLGLPIETELVLPELNDSFWVRVIGYGYPPPSRMMRWCTDRLKIKPSNKFILDRISEHGEVLILLGARYEESAQRANSLRRHEAEGGFSRHSTLPNAHVWSPIRHLTTEQVWAYLVFHESPWGGDNIALRDMYKSANAGECTIVLDETTEPCGNSRFGCYVCTVVERDKSLEGFVASGKDEYKELLDLRDWLAELRDNKAHRQSIRRNGQAGIGPLKITARRDLLDRVLRLQEALGEELITNAEVRVIRQAWLSDTLDAGGEHGLVGMPLPVVDVPG